MSREFPDFIDPWRAAEGGRRIAGTIPLARLKRLGPLLASSEGEARFEMQFGFDEQRRVTVSVHVSSPLSLTCQRSLEPYVELISQNSVLQVIGSEAEQALLSGEEEYILAEEGRLAVADIIEDELLLAIPQVPRNPEIDRVWKSTAGDRAAQAGDPGERDEGGGRQHPFESLADLMKK